MNVESNKNQKVKVISKIHYKETFWAMDKTLT